jgi:hypothetical protein
MKFSVKKEFGNEIRKIWDETKYDSIEPKNRGFAVQDYIEYNSLMFIGINPSYNGNPGNLFYDNSQGVTYKYYKKFIEISSEVGLNWSHLDLLFLRVTNQKEVKSLGENNLGHIFYDEQLKISKKIIETTKPKIIVVNNTYARDLLHSQSFTSPKYDIEFDEKIGTERIVNNEILNGVPIFFTSMLTGQRALDLGSYKRLIWHIKYVMKMI